MKLVCVSMWQPWATLLMLGLKTYETRSWSTSHRGLLGIHAAKRAIDVDTRSYFEDSGLREFIWDNHAFDVLGEYDGGHVHGALLGTVELITCKPTDAVYRPEPSWNAPFEDWPVPDVPLDYYLGDFTPGRFAWECSTPRIYTYHPSVRGQQGLFSVDVSEVPK